MSIIIPYISTIAVFLVVDFFGLSYLIKPIFEEHIGHLMADPFRIVPAAIFYAFFAGVLLWFVSWPALVEGKSLWWVLGNAALIGALGYGTYEFTSYAIMKDWHWKMVVADFTWGICLTAISATGGVLMTRLVT